MNRLLVFALVVILASVGLMGSSMNHEGAGCILATSQAMGCPEKSAPLDQFGFHANVFQQLSQANGFDLGAFFALIIVAGLTVTPLVYGSRSALLSTLSLQLGHLWNHPPPVSVTQKIIRWLKLANNRDPHRSLALA